MRYCILIFLLSIIPFANIHAKILYPIKATAHHPVTGKIISTVSTDGYPTFDVTMSRDRTHVTIKSSAGTMTLKKLGKNRYSYSGQKGDIAYYAMAYIRNENEVYEIIYQETDLKQNICVITSYK